MGWATHDWQAESQEPGALCAVGRRAVLAQWEAAQVPAFKVVLAYGSFGLERDGQISAPVKVFLPLLSPGTLPHGSMGPLFRAHLAPRYTLHEDGL